MSISAIVVRVHGVVDVVRYISRYVYKYEADTQTRTPTHIKKSQ